MHRGAGVCSSPARRPCPWVPFAVPAPRGSPPPSGARGGDEAAALGAPRAGALTVLRSCSAGSARRGCRGPPRPLAGPVRRPLEPGVLCACEADRRPPRGGPLSPRGWECWPQRPLAWFPGLPAQKWCAGRQQPGWRRLLEAVLVETRRKLAPRNEVPGRGGVWGTPWTVAPVQVTGPWERGAGKAGPAVEPQRSGKQAVPLAVGAIRRQSKDPPRVSRSGAVEATRPPRHRGPRGASSWL